MRLSNFLIWQAAYAEYYSTPAYWPDFDREELRKALDAYAQRQRKFGKLPEDWLTRTGECIAVHAYPRCSSQASCPATRASCCSCSFWLGGGFPGWPRHRRGAAWASRELVAALRQQQATIRCRPRHHSGGCACPAAAYLDASLALLLPVIALAIAASLALAMVRHSLDGALVDWALSLCRRMLYVALLLAYFVALRQHRQGPAAGC